MDPMGLERVRRARHLWSLRLAATVRIVVVFLMAGAFLIGTEPHDWPAQSAWTAVYAVAAIGTAVAAAAPGARFITGKRWQFAIAVIDIVALSGFQFLTSGGYIPLLVLALLPLMVVLDVSWARAAVVLPLSLAAFAATVLLDPVIGDQIGWPETWFLIVVYACLCGSTFSATYLQARHVDEIATQRVERARFAHQATHDSLTGLPNRAYVVARIADSVAPDGDGALSAVLFIDLDKLKFINDTMGHEAGDTAIRAAAQRLRGALRPDDVVARLGGDEFVALLFGPTTRDALDQLSERLHTGLAEPLEIGGDPFRLSASIGITTVDQHDERDASTMLHDADVAMYEAKTSGRSMTCHFTEDLRASQTPPAGRLS